MDQPRDESSANCHFTDKDVLSIEELNDLTRRPRQQGEVETQFGSVTDVDRLWRQLLYTVHHSTVLDKHLTATCNAICYVVRALANTTDPDLQEFVASDTICLECFEAARSAFAASKTKPALQVLETLAYLAKHDATGLSVSAGIPTAAMQMVRTIYTQKPQKSLKDACIILYFFLRKLSDSFSFSEVLDRVLSETKMSFLYFCRVSNISYNFPAGDPESNWISFILSLLMITPIADSKTAVLKLLFLICTNPKQNGSKMVNLVQKAIEIYGMSNERALEDITKDILPSIISTKEQFCAFLPDPAASTIHTAAKVNLVLSQLKLGLLKGYITEADLSSLMCTRLSATGLGGSNGSSSHKIFAILLSNADAEIRQNACELLLLSISLKISDNTGSLDCLIESLPALHDDNDAYHRGELYSIFRRFTLKVLQRLTALSNANHDSQGISFTIVDGFLRRYMEFLVNELEPSVSYSRHILALDLLCFVAKTVDPEKGLPCLSALSGINSQKALFRLALDPYNDIREAAVTTLFYLTKFDQPTFHACIREIHPLETTFKLAAASNRADHADALGRIISLLSTTSLETACSLIPSNYLSFISTSTAAESLESYVRSVREYHVSSQYALHGVTLGLSYSIAIPENLLPSSKVAETQILLLSACQRIWVVSQSHLCIDSPEVELDTEQEEDVDFGPKDVLAYAWRALRDSNVLMQAMLNNLTITLELLNTVGGMCFEQLCLLRHRGAFSTVAQTFLLCCQKARNHLPENGSQLIEEWFEKALLELESQADKLTRRSAGLPALFTALLNPHYQPSFIAQFDVLIKIAERQVPEENISPLQDKIRLPQVHALNCIKDIVTNSRFRSMTEPLVMRTINLAAKSMGSQIWAIKNCGLMLLRASINRLDPDTTLGASEAGLSTRSQSSAGKTPLDVAVFLLTEVNRNNLPNFDTQAIAQTEAEFAGLDLLGRLYIQEHDVHEVRELVTIKLGHPLWHIRAQAARLLVKMTQVGGELELLERIQEQLKHHLSVNEVHGTLLVLKEILSHNLQSSRSEESLQKLTEVLVTARRAIELTDNQTVLATWLNVVDHLLEASTSTELDTMVQEVAERIWSRSAPRSELRSIVSEEVVFRLLHSRRSDDDKGMVGVVEALNDDENVAINVIQRLKSKAMTADTLTVLTDIIMSSSADAVCADAMNAICGYLETNPASALSRVAVLYDRFNFNSPISRNLSLSQLKLFSHLCRHAWVESHATLIEKIQGSSAGFCLHLRSAAHDEYEETTRRATAETVLDLTRLSEVSGALTNLFGSNGQLEILSILYDLLNDDDEEIRQLASNAAARLNTISHERLDVMYIGNAFTSRRRLHEYMLRDFASDVSLKHECLRRILGWESDMAIAHLGPYLCNMAGASSVRQALNVIVAASNDLFAEEKQNLYIDDIAEVKAWTETICAVEARLDDHLMVALHQWAVQGIKALGQHLNTLKTSAKTCYDSALELLIIRTVTIARLMGIDEKALESLEAKCLEANMPASVWTAFHWLLQRRPHNS